MLLQRQKLLFWFLLITTLGRTTSVSFPLLDNLKTPFVVQLDTSKIRKYIDTTLENVIANVTHEIVELFQLAFDKCVKDALVNVYVKLDDINAKLTTVEFPKECNDLQISTDGVYTIYPADKSHPVHAYCVVEDNKKWTVIQRRDKKAQDFNRSWKDYKVGFGNANEEYWLGNENIHLISSNGRHQIRIKLENLSGKKAYADYSTFSVGYEESKYLLTTTGYSGTAGDSIDNVDISGKADGQRFSTKDQDNDGYGGNCADSNGGGWWYSRCDYGSINKNSPRWSYNFGQVDKSLMMITKIV